MGNLSRSLATLLFFSVMIAGCKSKKDNTSPVDQNNTTAKPGETAPVNSTPHDAVTMPESSSTATDNTVTPAETNTIWQRIEVYINTSPKEQHPTLTEVNNTLGRGMYLDVKELWYLTQFNIRKKLSKGVKGLNPQNFEQKYEEQYDIAIAEGY